MGVETFKAKRKEQNAEGKKEAGTPSIAAQEVEDMVLDCEAKENHQLPAQMEDELNGQPVPKRMETSGVNSENKAGADLSSGDINMSSRNIDSKDNSDLSDIKD